MAGFSTSLANAIINTTLRGQVFPTVRTTYIALFTSDPTDAFSAGTEVSAAWYVRQAAGSFSAPSNGTAYNTTQVKFAPVTGSNVTITHIGIVEGSSATDVTSTLLYSYALTEPKTLTVNDVYVVDTAGSSGDYTQNLL
jgi:hypothetical protein